jgi:predicted ATPase
LRSLDGVSFRNKHARAARPCRARHDGLLRGAIDLALDNHANAPRSNTQWVFFDRGLIDAAAAPQALDGTTILDTIAQSHRYHSRIFLAPPWPEIYVQDEERRHSMDEAG